MERLKDRIFVDGAPPSWRLRFITVRLLDGLRRSGFVSASTRLSVSLSCVGSARMTALNRQYRRKNGPTDVLSFEQPAQPGLKGVRELGDLVLCGPVARRQAADQRHGVRSELTVLVAHGLLHLLGFDHERSAAEHDRMARAEAKLLRASGYRGQKPGLIARSKI